MAEIIYCDQCGKRIREGEGKSAGDSKPYCATCFAQKTAQATAALTASTASHPIPADITKREAVHPKSGSSHKAIPRETPGGSRRSSANAHARNTEAHAKAPPANHQTKIIVGIVAAALLLCGVLVFALGGKSDRPVSAARPETPKPAAPVATDAHLTSTAETRPVVKPPEPAKPAVAEKEPSMDDIREGYARRTLTDLNDKNKSKAITPANYRKALTNLVSSHGSTKAGQEAKAVLADLPQEVAEAEPVKKPEPEARKPAQEPAKHAPVEAAGTAKELFRWKGDGDTNPWKEGCKDEKESSAGKAWSWKSQAVESGWISTKMRVATDVQALPKDGWLRIHVKTEGVKHLMFHSGVGDMILEIHKAGFKTGEWTWVGFKFSECPRDIRTQGKVPAWESERYGGSTIFGHSDSTPANVWIDEVIVGTGPMPEN
ncbi:MAG: hypothetical protein KIS92_15115 [Planctomycetota bacterium]|nr:hypothetical protein [Planctomycetota bacterium]